MSDHPHNDDLELGSIADVLADPSSWVEPRASLEDDVVEAVASAASPWRAGRRPGRRLMGVAAASAAAALVAGLALQGGSAAPQYAAQLRATDLAPGAHASAAV
ncbi:MAG: hypothetical protein ACRD0F_03720, partial [Acidimicrobiales bacterium]